MVVRVEDDTEPEIASRLNENWLWSIQSNIFCGRCCVGGHVRFFKDLDFEILAVGGYTNLLQWYTVYIEKKAVGHNHQPGRSPSRPRI